METKLRFACSTCGKQFERSPAHVKGKHGSVYCSRTCHYAGRTLGTTKRVVVGRYSIPDDVRARMSATLVERNRKRKAAGRYGHTDQTRAKMREATARALAEGRVSRVSKGEDKVAAILDELGVEYVRQWGLRDDGGRFAAVCDFYFPALNGVIEYNGTYWHADPRVYDSATLNATQRHNVGKYAAKVEMLAARGVSVSELWEKDFQQSKRQAVLSAYQRLT